MNFKIGIKCGSKISNVFFKDSFYYPSSEASVFHVHNYSEIHVITGGEAHFRIGENLFSCEDKNLIIIPQKVFHSFASNNSETKHIGFQIDCKINKFTAYSINHEFVSEFISEIENNRTSPDYIRISAYITMLCGYCGLGEKMQPAPITDYGYLIHEFLVNHYNEDLQLCDLARELCLSERQTERITLKYTGNSFSQALASTRINIAKQLIKNGEMSLSEISQHVGYRSYSGFYKAMKSFDKRTDNNYMIQSDYPNDAKDAK